MHAPRALLLIAAVAPFGAAADPFSSGPKLAWPVDCVLGESCHIQNYVDHDPGPGWRDFTCNGLSYDGHTGTDIALATRDMIALGVTVRAAQAGTVQATRDGVSDQLYAGQDLAGQECGNGVVIDHGDGWHTQYCHLREGSLRVLPGDQVDTGTALGEIGLSGLTEFAHVHFALRKDGTPVDPFAPEGAETCPPSSASSLWSDPVAYGAGGLLDVGFATGVPDYDAVKAGDATTPLLRKAPLVLFGYGYGLRPGDLWELTITGPEGPVFSSTAPQERARAQAFRAAGKRPPDTGWPPGRYMGTVEIHRNGTLMSQKTIATEIN